MSQRTDSEDLFSPLRERLDSLREENRQLRHQLNLLQQELADLRRGVGITVSVNGKPVPTGVGNPMPDVAPQPGNAAFVTPAILGDRRMPMPGNGGPPPSVPPTYFGQQRPGNIPPAREPGNSGSKSNERSTTLDFFLE